MLGVGRCFAPLTRFHHSVSHVDFIKPFLVVFELGFPFELKTTLLFHAIEIGVVNIVIVGLLHQASYRRVILVDSFSCLISALVLIFLS